MRTISVAFPYLPINNPPLATTALDLNTRARQAMLAAGFQPDFPPEARAELLGLGANSTTPTATAARDLRGLLWSSIDNDASRDLDQVEYMELLEDGAVRLLVGVADVDATVGQGSAIDQYAGREATSVYTGVATFPMLPEELSSGATSLLDEQDRVAMVVELRLAASGEATAEDCYPARLRNRAKLAYSSVGAWLEGRGPVPPAVATVPGMEEQLRLQLETAQKLRHIRKQHGALTFGSVEANPVVENGEVKDLALRRHNVAEDIIESFMVAANVGMAQHLKKHNALCLRRVVRTPRRWDRIQAIAQRFGTNLPAEPNPQALCAFLDQRRAADPDHFPDLSLSIVKLLGPGEYVVEPPGAEQQGHFGLAAHDYTHSTAPNRRYADLVTQRLLKAVAGGRPGPYLETDLRTIAAHCTEREDAARKVERLMRKVAAACLLSTRVGEVFDGIVTGAAPKGTYVRLLRLPAEGRVIRGEQGVDVGDRVRVRLISVDIAKGFIDFERLPAAHHC